MAMATATSVTGGVDEYSNFDYLILSPTKKKDNKKRGWYWRYIQEHGSCPLTKQFKQDDYDGDDDDPWLLSSFPISHFFHYSTSFLFCRTHPYIYTGTRFVNKRKGGGIDSRGGGGR